MASPYVVTINGVAILPDIPTPDHANLETITWKAINNDRTSHRDYLFFFILNTSNNGTFVRRILPVTFKDMGILNRWIDVSCNLKLEAN